MFLAHQSNSDKKEYFDLLKIVSGLSNLFSDNDIPYLYYRAAENIFCKAFNANNLSRSDTSADASKDNIGIGIKTYLNNNGSTLQKIAEFNKTRTEHSKLIEDPIELVKYISNLRNLRIESTKATHSIDELIYHCIARDKNKFFIYEENMSLIDIKNIRNVKRKENIITYCDKINDYSFSLSKSTLSKRFNTNNPIELLIDIISDPYLELKRLYDRYRLNFENVNTNIESIILPLYSYKYGKVSKNSGLNQWHANGRNRNPNEVYIPVPAIVHHKFQDFFPPNEVNRYFNLHLPNGNTVTAKMCQKMEININGEIINKGKGLMSIPNSDLGEWLLRDVLKIPENTLVTYEMLEDIGIDSVEVRKKDIENYEIDFKKVNSFNEFLNQ